MTDLPPHPPAADATRPVGAVQVSIACEGGDVTMSAWDPASGQRARRTVPLSGTARVTRPRLLALSAVELAATVLAEALARSPAPPAPSQREAAIAAPGTRTETSAQGVSSWRLVAFGGAEWFPGLGDLPSGGVRFGFDGRGVGGASIDAQVSHGSVANVAGTVAVASLSLSPQGGVHHTFGRYTIRAETGPRLAVGRMRGEIPPGLPGMAMTVTAPWIGWQLELGMGAAIARHLVLEVTLSSGYVLAPLGGRILTERKVAIEGAWLGAFLSLGARANAAN